MISPTASSPSTRQPSKSSFGGAPQEAEGTEERQQGVAMPPLSPTEGRLQSQGAGGEGISPKAQAGGGLASLAGPRASVPVLGSSGGGGAGEPSSGLGTLPALSKSMRAPNALPPLTQSKAP